GRRRTVAARVLRGVAAATRLLVLRGLGRRRGLAGLGALSRLPHRAPGRLLLALDLLDDRLTVGDPGLRLGVGGGPLALDELLVVAERGGQTLTHGRVRGRLDGRRLGGVRRRRHDEGAASRHRRRAQQQRQLLLGTESSPTRHARLLKRGGGAYAAMYEIPNGVTQRSAQVREVTCVTPALGRAALPGQRVPHHLLAAADHRGAVVRGDDGPLDQLGVLRERRDPPVPRTGVPRPLLEPELLGRTLLGARDVPRLQTEPPEHLAALVLARYGLQVSPDGVLGALGVEQADGAAALGTGRIDPDLHAPHRTPAPPRITAGPPDASVRIRAVSRAPCEPAVTGRQFPC